MLVEKNGMEYIPEQLRSSVDWQLVCSDGTKLPCHSLILASVSKILAEVMVAVQRPRRRGELTDVPFEGAKFVGKWFLKWVYERKSFLFSADTAYHLSRVAHMLDSNS